jgi:segregation and condensation protein B
MRELSQLKAITEAALLAAGRPLTIDQLLALFEEHEAPERKVMREALDALTEDYRERGIELVEVASGYRFHVRSEYAPWISRLWEERPGRYSRALMETLALIAYRQPITRGEIEEVRGVSVSTNIIKTLLEREWVRVVGHRDVPGKPSLYATTRAFLDYFGLRSLDDLPPLAEIRDLDALNGELALGIPGVEADPQDTAEAVRDENGNGDGEPAAAETVDEPGRADRVAEGAESSAKELSSEEADPPQPESSTAGDQAARGRPGDAREAAGSDTDDPQPPAAADGGSKAPVGS